MAKLQPSMWKILPTRDGHFQWAVTGADAWPGSTEPSKTLAADADDEPRSRLSSMKDLLLQAEQTNLFSSKRSFLEQHVADPRRVEGGAAMFSTGSGKSLSVRQSSIQKARSLLEDLNTADNAIAASCRSDCFPMFRTGLGKAVQVTESSMKKAAALLEGTNDKQDQLMDQIDLLKHKKNDNGISMNAGFRIGKTIDDNRVATLQSNPHFDSREIGLLRIPVCTPVDHSIHEEQDNRSTYPPLKFHTAGGRSISISTDALKRARTLLDDLGSEAFDGEVNANVLARSTCENEKISSKAPSNIKSVSFDSSHEERFLNRNVLEIPSPAKQLCRPLMKPIDSSALSMQVYSKHDRISSNNGSWSKPPNEYLFVEHIIVPLVENHLNGEKQISGKGRPCSSFKRPRISSSSRLAETEAAQPSTSVNCYCRASVSLRYPFRLQRRKLKDFFGGPPCRFSMLENVPDGARYMTSDTAENYRFRDTCSNIDLGPEELREMLLQSGASQGGTTEKWVSNHYKWIVWKLACLERCYPSKTISRFLTVSNVLEELKYRYEREVNYGHRSALKKVLDGDLSPSSMMILCVSAIRSGRRTDEMFSSSNLHENGNKLIEFDSNYAVTIELTDGWYSMDATLDMHLSKQLITGKLFVGQKLRVCGATLCGWDEPVSPLEANMVSFVLHINGTYRAHWADSLGLCKGVRAPLDFRCIKGGGGRVPSTVVGISRLYPILYKERLPDGGSIVRSESLEKKILQLYSQRRSDIAEDIISELEDAPIHVTDSGEGAKILRILEGSSEPEVLMAGMSSEQLISFSTYQAKQEALRQDNLHKKIEKAFEEAGLGSRDVTPFMRVKVMGLISVGSSRQGRPREGLITIWNPTEKQRLDLVEGVLLQNGIACLPRLP
ncbi:hypothetical protein KSP39_PZI006686 [Platanthera zijinensis]|uniref:Tower domain-containing protein n=1 Tax=Platanthera zijinensis TaxID=2320716 RepID=A0AAP0GAA2_9ASPA